MDLVVLKPDELVLSYLTAKLLPRSLLYSLECVRKPKTPFYLIIPT